GANEAANLPTRQPNFDKNGVGN
ncbi:MAG: hypothetical protein RIS64_4546, partial [Bacteroidota bacterium]